MSTGQKNIPIASRFRAERERLGFSRPELAAALDVTPGTVKNWEAGSSSPDADVLAKLHGIGVDVMYVLMGSREDNVVAQRRAEYLNTPGQQLAVKISVMRLSHEDAEALLAVAKRLDEKKT